MKKILLNFVQISTIRINTNIYICLFMYICTLYIYIYICICKCICYIHMYIHTHIVIDVCIKFNKIFLSQRIFYVRHSVSVFIGFHRKEKKDT